MQLRAINQALTYKKACKKWNKQTGYNLTASQIATLYVIYRQSKSKATTAGKAVQLECMKIGYAAAYPHVITDINTLIALYLVNKYHSDKSFTRHRYSISIEGINALFELEKIHRKERLDR